MKNPVFLIYPKQLTLKEIYLQNINQFKPSEYGFDGRYIPLGRLSYLNSFICKLKKRMVNICRYLKPLKASHLSCLSTIPDDPSAAIYEIKIISLTKLPVCAMNSIVGLPFTKGDIKLELMQALTHVIHCLSKLIKLEEYCYVPFERAF